MASRLFVSQFNYSFEKMLVELVGKFTQSVAAAKARLALGATTATALSFGSAGNSITIALVDPGAASQSLSISVVGTAITVHLATDSGSAITSTYTQIKTAINADVSASALVTVSGTDATVATALAATPLAGGADSTFTDNLPIPAMAMSRVSTGLYRVTLSDKYMALLSAQLTLISSSLTDLQLQVKSEDVAASKQIDINVYAIGSGSPVLTDLAAGMAITVDLKLRNVS